MPKTRAQLNRGVRQEALREQLSNQGHLQHVIDMVDKLQNLDTPLEALDVTRIKAAIDSKLKLIGKYLPDMRHIEADVTTDNATIEDFVKGVVTGQQNDSSEESQLH
jgi:hypothetical protein